MTIVKVLTISIVLRLLTVVTVVTDKPEGLTLDKAAIIKSIKDKMA